MRWRIDFLPEGRFVSPSPEVQFLFLKLAGRQDGALKARSSKNQLLYNTKSCWSPGMKGDAVLCSPNKPNHGLTTERRVL